MSEDGTPTLPQVRLAATLAALGFRPAPLPPVAAAAQVARVDGDRFRISASTASMGTRVSITTLSPSRDLAEHAIGRAFEELRRVVPLLDRRDGASAVSVLNVTGALRRPPPELTRVLARAQEIHTLSRGAFDITVKPLVDQMRRTGQRLEPGPELREALALVDSSALVSSPDRVQLRKRGMGVTLDGIAKGYVVDRMAHVLASAGLHDWLVEAGGDIRASGRNQRRQPWRVGVQDPDKKGPFPDVTEIHGGAVATSGGYESCYGDDPGVHHIVDASSGRCPTRTRSASVAAPDTQTADALATVALLLSPSRALALVEALPLCSCLLLDSQGRRLASSRWRSVSSPVH